MWAGSSLEENKLCHRYSRSCLYNISEAYGPNIKIEALYQASNVQDGDTFQVFVGQSFNATCFANGSPTPNIHWRREQGGHEIELPPINFKNISALENNGTGLAQIEMRINQIVGSDAGVYRCVAWNRVNNVSKRIQLVVSKVIHCLTFNYGLDFNL